LFDLPQVVERADQLAVIGVAGLVTNLVPASAASELFRRSIVLSFDRNAFIFVPSLTAAAGNVGFVGQAQPIPIRQLDTSQGIVLAPSKLAVVVVLTRELLEGSNAEQLVR
jgi:hypothetical protein